MDNELNLFDFGTNQKGEYVNLEEEKVYEEELELSIVENYVKERNDPLMNIIWQTFFPYHFTKKSSEYIISELEKVFNTKTYHFGNMAKDLYIFSLKRDDKYVFVFQNEKHYLVSDTPHFELINGDIVEYSIEDILSGKDKICFPALHAHCYDTNGELIVDYHDAGDNWKKDIRHIVIIDEWQMDKYSTNRMYENKKIKDFYECEFYMSDLIEYWGENC